jgi:hypothetical protein
MNPVKRLEALEHQLTAGACEVCGNSPGDAQHTRCVVIYPGDLRPNITPCPQCGASATLIEVLYVDRINQSEVLS